MIWNVSLGHCIVVVISFHIVTIAAVICFRYQLHSKKNKVDKIPQRKPMINASQDVARCLSNCFHTEDYIDTIRPLCNSMISGTINTCKTRIINFVSSNRMYQGMFYRYFAKKVSSEEKTRHLQLVWFTLSQVIQGHSRLFSRKCLMKL